MEANIFCSRESTTRKVTDTEFNQFRTQDFVHLFISMFIYSINELSLVWLFVYPLFVCLFACLPIHLFIHYLDCLFAHLFICLFTYSLVYSLFCLFVCLCTFFFVYLYTFFFIILFTCTLICLLVSSFVCSFAHLCTYLFLYFFNLFFDSFPNYSFLNLMFITC